MLAILVQRRAPGHLLRRRVDLHGTRDRTHGREHLARHIGDRPVGNERHSPARYTAVFDHGLVRAKVKRHHERAIPVGCREWERLPPPRGQAQRGVLQLRLWGGQCHGQLAEQLGVGVQRVACLAPALI